MAGTKIKLDRNFLILIGVLTLWGFVAFASVSAPLSQRQFGNQYHLLLTFVFRNIILGALVFMVATMTPWRTLRRFAPALFLVALMALALAFIPAFRLSGQTTARWLDLKFFSFQPSELMKLALLLWLSVLLPRLRRQVQSPATRGLAIIAIVGLVSVLIYLQPALSNLIILWAMIIGGFLSTASDRRELMPLILLAILFLILSPLWGYRASRLASFIQRGTNERVGFQGEQTRLAVGSGGLWGRGIGNSKLKLIGVPLMVTDSIFAIYAEETGFLGSIALIVAFILLVAAVAQRGAKSTDPEQRFFASGLAVWLSAQAFIHVASNIGVIPTTGVPLPFFSYGPSSHLAIMAALGIVHRLARS